MLPKILGADLRYRGSWSLQKPLGKGFTTVRNLNSGYHKALRLAATDAARGAQITYFGGFQFLTILITLGVGTDYFFIFFDAYKQSLLEPLVCASQITRIDYTCKRAAQVRSCVKQIREMSDGINIQYTLFLFTCRAECFTVDGIGWFNLLRLVQ